jgi:cytidyltransferase-like protein
MTNKKPFELGVTVGRFQTFHTGHRYMIEKALAVCGEVGILVGSSQESGTYKNPFSYNTRERILKKIFGDRVRIYPLPDIGVGNNSKWGDYVLENIKDKFGKSPDLLVSGKEDRRLDWFDSVEGVTIAELYVPKIINISASEMRDFFVNDDFENWKRFTDEALWDEYESLRAEVMSAKDNLFTESL